MLPRLTKHTVCLIFGIFSTLFLTECSNNKSVQVFYSPGNNTQGVSTVSYADLVFPNNYNPLIFTYYESCEAFKMELIENTTFLTIAETNIDCQCSDSPMKEFLRIRCFLIDYYDQNLTIEFEDSFSQRLKLPQSINSK